MNKLDTLNKTRWDRFIKTIETHYGKNAKSISFDGSRQEQWTLAVNKDGTFERNVKPEIDIEVTIKFDDDTTVEVEYDWDIGVDDIDLWAEEIAMY